MSSKKKGQQSKKAPNKPNNQVQTVRQLKALVIADSFDEQFRPITFEKPRALLPVVGIPLLKYTLEFLATAKVEEVIVFCCSKSEELSSFIDDLNNDPRALGIPVTCLINKDTKSVGEALRGVRQSELIRDDFILVYGDIVSNIEMESLVNDHIERSKKDKSTVMTLLLSKSHVNRNLRIYTKNQQKGSMVIGIDDESGQVVYCEDKLKKYLNVSRQTFLSSRSISFHTDLEESGIAICSPELLTLFEDNFDYQLLSQMVKGVVNGEEVVERKIFARTVGNKHYTSRISSLDQYHQVTRDILTRYSYPFVPDNNFDDTSYTYLRERYQEMNVKLSRSCIVRGYSSIGKGSSVEDESSVVSSTIGRNCKIGSNVKIRNSHIWDNVVIGDNVTIENAIVCSDTSIGKGCIIESGSIISFNVKIGAGIKIPEFSRLTNCVMENQMHDDEADDSEQKYHVNKIDLGEGGCGMLWSLNMDSDDNMSEEEEEEEEHHEDEYLTDNQRFNFEIEETLKRAIEKNISIDNLMSEMNALKFAYDKTLEECGASVFIALLNQVDLKNVLVSLSQLLAKWSTLVTNFANETEAQVELLFAIQEYFTDHEEFAPHFENTMFLMYDKHKILSEDAILEWEEEVVGDQDEEGLVFVKQSKNFLEWLKDGDDDDDDDEDDEEEDEEDEEDSDDF